MNSLCKEIAKTAARLKEKDIADYGAKNEDLKKVTDRINYLKAYAEGKKEGSGGGSPSRAAGNAKKLHQSNQIKYKISLTHELCYLPHNIIDMALPQVWNGQNKNSNFKEIFLQRNPLNRAVSIYYFWGELFKLKEREKDVKSGSQKAAESVLDMLGIRTPEQQRRILSQDMDALKVKTKMKAGRLGTSNKGNDEDAPIKRIFLYHGNENTAPDADTAEKFARDLPYNNGMPGPTITWTAFAHKKEFAFEKMRQGNMFTMVTERMEESLIALRYYLGWQLADVVVTKQRKALSKHPKVSDWPESAVQILNSSLVELGEWETYRLSNELLDNELDNLRKKGVNIDKEISMLNSLQARVSPYCLRNEILKNYQMYIKKLGYWPHPAGTINHLRDTEDKYGREGHAFSLNKEIMYTYDVCGSCEAHAMMYSIENGYAANVENALFLHQLREKISLEGNVDFTNCP